eukprot:354460-Chlamydomonas_euryale.AAC.10
MDQRMTFPLVGGRRACACASAVAASEKPLLDSDSKVRELAGRRRRKPESEVPIVWNLLDDCLRRAAAAAVAFNTAAAPQQLPEGGEERPRCPPSCTCWAYQTLQASFAPACAW